MVPHPDLARPGVFSGSGDGVRLALAGLATLARMVAQEVKPLQPMPDGAL